MREPKPNHRFEGKKKNPPFFFDTHNKKCVENKKKLGHVYKLNLEARQAKLWGTQYKKY